MLCHGRCKDVRSMWILSVFNWWVYVEIQLNPGGGHGFLEMFWFDLMYDQVGWFELDSALWGLQSSSCCWWYMQNDDFYLLETIIDKSNGSKITIHGLWWLLHGSRRVQNDLSFSKIKPIDLTRLNRIASWHHHCNYSPIIKEVLSSKKNIEGQVWCCETTSNNKYNIIINI